MDFYDSDGQPPRQVNFERRLVRTTEEIVGFLRGVMADQHLDDAEIHSLCRMLCDRAPDVDGWLFGELCQRLNRAMDDGISDASRKMLQEAIMTILGGNADTIVHRNSTAVPLDKPCPTISFQGKTFVLTGKFLHGTRRECEQEVILRGGLCNRDVTRSTNFVVIGALGSMDWLHTTHGLKIQRAVKLRSETGLGIISEENWTAALAKIAVVPSLVCEMGEEEKHLSSLLSSVPGMAKKRVSSLMQCFTPKEIVFIARNAHPSAFSCAPSIGIEAAEAIGQHLRMFLDKSIFPKITKSETALQPPLSLGLRSLDDGTCVVSVEGYPGLEFSGNTKREAIDRAMDRLSMICGVTLRQTES